MMPRPYSLDAHTRAQDLASSVLSSSSPSAIASAVSAVETILRKLSADQSRAFFSIAFPAIICRLFGFDDSSQNTARSPAASTAWIEQAYHDPDLAARLFALLSPHGLLFSAISSADRHGLVNYAFPAERLPEWMRYALQSERHFPVLVDLCPLFRGRVKEDPIQDAYQLQLNAFEYYIFWFAYYPVCKGNSEGSDNSLVEKSRRKSRLVNWTSSLPILVNPSRRSGQKAEVSLYLRLLYAYLSSFVPKGGLGSYQPYRSSLLHYSSSCDISVFEQAEFLVYTLIHFWLVDNDFSPISLTNCRSFGISFPYRAVSVEAPPTAGLGEAVKLFVLYLSFCLVSLTEGSNQKVLESVGSFSMRPMISLGNTADSWNSAVQRPLYRFVLRTFLFCPIGVSMNNVAQVLSAWVTYIAPWLTHPDDFVEFEPPTMQKLESSKKNPVQGKNNGENGRSNPETVFSPLWEGYVASNYLFYSSLVVHFIGFAHKFLHTNIEAVVYMVLKDPCLRSQSNYIPGQIPKLGLFKDIQKSLIAKDTLSVYTSSYNLTEGITGLSLVPWHRFTLLQKRINNAVSQFLMPGKLFNLYQDASMFLDWEGGLCESDADGSFLHDNWNRDLKLFNDGEDGALKLLQLFVLRAEHEIKAVPGDSTRSLQSLDSIKLKMNVLFDCAISRSPHRPNPAGEARAVGRSREAFTPKRPGFRTGCWADVKYKGDWMHRPISDAEVAWLARLLIRASDWLNEALALDPVDGAQACGPIYVELSSGDRIFEGGPKEAALVLLSLTASWLGLLGHSVLGVMRGRGMRINLRVFSSKKMFMFLVIFGAGYGLKKALSQPTTASSLAHEAELTRNCT
ncbi:hypothetical protein KSP40_PGU002029 [Platanthera guangdongensis]|uniref:Sphingomyelin phosphodiesterase 4 n=1 Tax=Platanthera guangdongensis TaxID=2320717 RepID=A0ABR2MZN0_9ASPA